MQFVEIPVGFRLRIIEQFQNSQQSVVWSNSWLKAGFRPLGHGPLMTSGIRVPNAHWYTTGDGVMVGISPDQSLQSSEALTVTYPQTLSPLDAIKSQVTAKVASPWELAHDFRKFHMEVSTAARFLSEISLLACLLVKIQQQGDDHEKEYILASVDGSSLNAGVVRHLLRGQSIYEYAGASEELLGFGIRSGSEFLYFDTLSVAFESPFSTLLKGKLKWDSNVGVTHILATLAMFMSLSYDQPETEADSEISCSTIEHVSEDTIIENPNFISSCNLYQADLDRGGVRAKQRYLKLLGYDAGVVDGIAGEKTRKAMTEFCNSIGVACLNFDSDVFSEALVSAMAVKYPVVISADSDKG